MGGFIGRKRGKATCKLDEKKGPCSFSVEVVVCARDNTDGGIGFLLTFILEKLLPNNNNY